mmetsp:Transcript_1723/g.5389  ORF Transcript_1723/g.5389 Transcript_1723/m.5389 type:complete len:250 (+) Transcript_1723:422-1171(+)
MRPRRRASTAQRTMRPLSARPKMRARTPTPTLMAPSRAAARTRPSRPRTQIDSSSPRAKATWSRCASCSTPIARSPLAPWRRIDARCRGRSSTLPLQAARAVRPALGRWTPPRSCSPVVQIRLTRTLPRAGTRCTTRLRQVATACWRSCSRSRPGSSPRISRIARTSRTLLCTWRLAAATPRQSSCCCATGRVSTQLTTKVPRLWTLPCRAWLSRRPPASQARPCLPVPRLRTRSSSSQRPSTCESRPG